MVLRGPDQRGQVDAVIMMSNKVRVAAKGPDPRELWR